MGLFFKFKLDDYNEDYYRIYEKRRKIDFSSIPSFRKMKSMLALSDGEKLLDAGCGDGNLLEFFCRGTACKGYGIDASDAAVGLAKKQYPDLDLSRQDLLKIDYPDNYFDKAVCYNVIEHIYDQEKVLAELKRVVKPGGTLILGTIIKDSLCWKLYQLLIGEHTHVREFNVREFVDFVGTVLTIKENAVTSGVFRLPPPFVWFFHYILKGDIIVSATNNKEN